MKIKYKAETTNNPKVIWEEPPITQIIPLVTMGCPTFTTTTVPSLSTISIPSSNFTRIPRPIPRDHSKRHPDAISRFVTVRRTPSKQTDIATDIQTDRHMGLATGLYQELFTLNE